MYILCHLLNFTWTIYFMTLLFHMYINISCICINRVWIIHYSSHGVVDTVWNIINCTALTYMPLWDSFQAYYVTFELVHITHTCLQAAVNNLATKYIVVSHHNGHAWCKHSAALYYVYQNWWWINEYNNQQSWSF